MIVGVTAAASALFHILDLGNVALLYLVPVMAAATLFGLRTGLFAESSPASPTISSSCRPRAR